MQLPKRIETPRLIIRPHRPSDHDAFAEFMTDDVATRYIDFEPEHKTADGARELLDYVIASYDSADPVLALAILDKSTRAYLGYCGLAPVADENAAEGYYSLLPKYWGWGFATEAGAALLYYGFRELQLESIVSHMVRGNPRALKVAEKLGMKDDGPYKENGSLVGRRFVITREEYLEQRSPNHRMREEDARG